MTCEYDKEVQRQKLKKTAAYVTVPILIGISIGLLSGSISCGIAAWSAASAIAIMISFTACEGCNRR